MTDLTNAMQLKHAIAAARVDINARLDALEALADRALPPADDPGACVGIPHGRQAKKAWYKKNGIRSGGLHGGRIAGQKSNAMKTAG